MSFCYAHDNCRDLINSRFGVSYSNFSFLTPTFWKVSIDKYGKTPTLSGGQHFKILVRTLNCKMHKGDASEKGLVCVKRDFSAMYDQTVTKEL